MIEMPPVRRVLKSRWLLPMNAPPIENAVVEIEGDHIKYVGGFKEFRGNAESVTDFGDAIILPGLINLHSHIEYTELRGFDYNSKLFDWIPGLMSHVRDWKDEDFRRSACKGAREYLLSGTTCIVDSSYSGQAAVALGQQGLRGVVALELFGLDPASVELYWQRWLDKKENFLSSVKHQAESGDVDCAATLQAIEKGTLKISVAPHAPYTVSLPLMAKAARWARDHRLPFTIHVSESAEELAWALDGNQTVDDFLLRLSRVTNVFDLSGLSWRATKRSPIASMSEGRVLSEFLIAAHCVHIGSDDIEHLAISKTAVAHCPRSNAFLRNGVAPLGALIDAGVRVGFGTDSAASTEDLSVLNEARFAWQLHRATDSDFSLSAEQALRMLTVDAAQYIGLSDIIGTIEPGKLADLAIFQPQSCHDFVANNAYDLLMYNPISLRAVYIGGRPADVCR